MAAFESQWKEFNDLNLRLRGTIKLMAKQKANLSSKQKNKRENAQKEVERLYEETCAIFSYLKALKEKSLRRRTESQSKLNEICQRVDDELLRVHNFEYEHDCTKQQISICNNFDSEGNEPELISKEEFYQKNPSKKGIQNEHDEKAERLKYELLQRRALQANLSEISQKTKALSSELSEKQSFLNSLKSKIRGVFNEMEPLQKFMNLPLSMIYPNESEIDSLPSPLFAIYQSFMTQMHCNRQLNEKQIEIRVIQASKEQKIGKKRKFNQMSVSSGDNLEDGELSQEPPRKRAKMKNHSSSKNIRNSRQKLEELIDSTALSIKFNEICIALDFAFCSQSNLILVALKREIENEWRYEDPAVFMNLFDGHSMIKLPQSMRAEKRFFAFSWAQELGGCYLIKSKKETDEKRVLVIVNLNMLRNALMQRIKNRDAMKREIERLIKLKIDENILGDSKLPSCKLLSFSKVSNQGGMQNEWSEYFKAVLEHQDGFSLDCHIEIAASYPRSLPLFYSMNISKKDGLQNDNFFINQCKNIQIKMNENENECQNKELLLSTMICRLQRYFDIFVKSTFQSNDKSLDECTKRVHRGRDRRYPY